MKVEEGWDKIKADSPKGMKKENKNCDRYEILSKTLFEIISFQPVILIEC